MGEPRCPSLSVFSAAAYLSQTCKSAPEVGGQVFCCSLGVCLPAAGGVCLMNNSVGSVRTAGLRFKLARFQGLTFGSGCANLFKVACHVETSAQKPQLSCS